MINNLNDSKYLLRDGNLLIMQPNNLLSTLFVLQLTIHVLNSYTIQFWKVFLNVR